MNSPLPYATWLDSNIAQDSFVLRTTSQGVISTAIKHGLGIGFMPEHEAQANELVEITAPEESWLVNLWLVTHADLRRTLKVQEFIKFARACDQWPTA